MKLKVLSFLIVLMLSSCGYKTSPTPIASSGDTSDAVNIVAKGYYLANNLVIDFNGQPFDTNRLQLIRYFISENCYKCQFSQEVLVDYKNGISESKKNDGYWDNVNIRVTEDANWTITFTDFSFKLDDYMVIRLFKNQPTEGELSYDTIALLNPDPNFPDINFTKIIADKKSNSIELAWEKNISRYNLIRALDSNKINYIVNIAFYKLGENFPITKTAVNNGTIKFNLDLTDLNSQYYAVYEDSLGNRSNIKYFYPNEK